MDTGGVFRPLDESLLRDLPQLQSLRIAPLREPVSSRTLSAPSPLEPNASGARDSKISKTSTSPNNAPAKAKSNASLPTVTEFLNAARSSKADSSADSQSNVEPPPRPILPAFVNLRALERVPFASSFDDHALHGPRKRRRLDIQAESFGEHLQLPIPQAQKEQRPPPFGPFAILNGLNEPPPNAALLPPIEAGSITQLLTKPSRVDEALESGTSQSSNPGLVNSQPSERREARLEEILGVTLDDKDLLGGNEDDGQGDDDVEPPKTVEHVHDPTPTIHEKGQSGDGKESPVPTEEGNEPMSPKTRGRSRLNVRRWTEEETTALLRGVVKCGIGNWKTILAQPELEFNKRTASNLKDRFRVCYPWAYRAANPNEAIQQLHTVLSNSLSKADGEGRENTPVKLRPLQPRRTATTGSESTNSGAGSPPALSIVPSTSSVSTPPDTDTPSSSGSIQPQTPPSARSTATLSNQSRPTLVPLGIPEPHVTTKPKRRSRRPFTPAEDEALLKGYAVHGFQWTLIQRDSRLNLGHRRPADLRDRFRTKFPHAYKDGGSVSGNALHTQASGQDLSTSTKSTSTPRDQAANSSEQSPPRPPATSHSRAARPKPRHSPSGSLSNPGPIDSSLLLPVPAQGFLEPSASSVPASAGFLSFSLDENPTASASSGVDTPWGHNTLAPMVWDDLN
ncbi:uncharacterized protein PFLUO_LOCUS661 [Penicillium psychrofluorescens]|uniref:uncharacterized protein n=1 Tax=Penicillium psychrofluorescens TaxID=3158075 RepID=UPI003CCD00CF